MRKTFKYLLLSALGCLTGTNAWAEDYSIASADDLVAFAAAVNGGETDANATLTADIDMSEHSWTPIGDAEGMAFKGTIDGGGFAISNLVMDAATENGFCGFIAQATRGAVVKNLTLDATCSFTNANNYTGAFICRGVAGDGSAVITITDCVNKATVTSTKKWTAGFVAHSAVPVNFTRCTNEGTIQSYQLPAGFIGQATATLTFTGCTNKGAVTATQNTNTQNGSEAAGFLAYHTTQGASLRFTNCVNEGEIYSAGSRAAGFGGNLTTSLTNTACTLTNCVNRGKITSGVHLPGGFFASAYCVLSMTDCTNEGEIVCVNGNSGAAQMAGFVGTTTTGCVFNATRCYNTGKLTANGKNNVAAFVGYQGTYSKTTLTNCYNTADCATTGSNGRAFIASGNSGSGAIKFVNCWNSGKTSVSTGNTFSYQSNTVTNTYDLYNTAATYGAANLISDYEDTWKESGALTYYINDKAGSNVYYQTIGTDEHPVLSNASAVVYKTNDAGISTYYGTEAVTFSEGINVYTGYVEGNVVKLTKQQNTIPAQTAVVIEGTYYNRLTAESAPAITGTNDLVGSTTAVTSDGTQYALAIASDNKPAFLKVKSGIEIPAGKAYIVSTSGVKSFAIGSGETGLNEVTTDNGQQTTVVYDLQGRRVEKATKGIYIINGKKVLR